EDGWRGRVGKGSSEGELFRGRHIEWGQLYERRVGQAHQFRLQLQDYRQHGHGDGGLHDRWQPARQQYAFRQRDGLGRPDDDRRERRRYVHRRFGRGGVSRRRRGGQPPRRGRARQGRRQRVGPGGRGACGGGGGGGRGGRRRG